MKRRVSLSIALALSLLLSLISLPSTTKGQILDGPLMVADTGIITLGPNQVLRMSFLALQEATQMESRRFQVRFRQIRYAQGTCNDGVCKHAISSQTTSAPVTLVQGESASIDIPNTSFGVRAVVLSDSRDVKITAQIIDVTTGNIIAILIG